LGGNEGPNCSSNGKTVFRLGHLKREPIYKDSEERGQLQERKGRKSTFEGQTAWPTIGVMDTSESKILGGRQRRKKRSAVGGGFPTQLKQKGGDGEKISKKKEPQFGRSSHGDVSTIGRGRRGREPKIKRAEEGREGQGQRPGSFSINS